MTESQLKTTQHSISLSSANS